MNHIVEVNNLSYVYDQKPIFKELQISIKKESITLILGSNSSGKTTLIRLLSGILPSQDCITIDGITLNKRNLRSYMLLFGVVFFDDNYKFLFDNVIDELSFPLENLNFKKESISNRLYEIRNIVGLEECINKKTSELTTLEQVKVLIGMTLVHKPKIIFLDNPFRELKSSEIKELFQILHKVKKHIAVVITSSNLEEILSFDDVIVIGDGQALIQDTPVNVLKQDNTLAKAGLLIPPMIDLSLKLQFYDVLDEIITDVDRMVDRLWT